MRNLILLLPTLLVGGCVNVPPPALSKSDAVARSRIVHGSAADTSRRVELPPNTTGTGRHDFYNLFARVSYDSPAVYGISIATSSKINHSDAVVASDAFGPLKVEGRQQVSAGLGINVSYLEAMFTRDILDRAATSGVQLAVSSSRGSISFAVPDWMIAALVEVADKYDSFRSTQQSVARIKAQTAERQREKQRIRELYVQVQKDLDPRIKKAVLEGSLVLGMSKADAIASWGDPQKINRSVGSFGVHEQWVYGDTYVYFDDGKLSSWQD